MLMFRTLSPVIFALSFFAAIPAHADTTTTPCTSCGTSVSNNVTVNVDFTALAETFNKVIDALTALGMKPSINNGVFNYNSGVINHGNYNSGTQTATSQSQDLYNTGNNNLINLLAGGRGGGGGGGGGGDGGGGLPGGFKSCGSGAVCGRRW